ncbi:major facilitator superfamily domain-containing protein [Aspergillus avenaceus]|uniref:Major facilitator superfamily domain-containing protein n=1 Tax=Aspergillus avenaceus TaxID=36643 RepID=A0A5N6U4L9_ASPAV|nr:major facilitator superfamily domain-containing protein [Aspergillus avenaceus]
MPRQHVAAVECQIENDDAATRYNMRVANEIIEQIGFGRYQWHMFITCGFGFLVDQMLPVALGLVLPQITKQWEIKYPEMMTVSVFAGLLVGSVFCGPLVDMFGRRSVWMVSLFGVTLFTMVMAASPNHIVFAIICALQHMFTGGNLAIDLTVYVENLPKSKDFILTAVASWWALGSALGGLIAWPLIEHFSCPIGTTPTQCKSSDNMGWRYQYIVIGGLSLIMALVRTLVLPMEESPKWLIAQGRFQEAVVAFRKIAGMNKREIDISVEMFQSLHPPLMTSSKMQRTMAHIRALFVPKRLALSTTSVIVLWMCMGVAYPTYTVFLPVYLANNGAHLGSGSTFQTYRDYTISSTVGIFGPLVSAFLVNIRLLGRRRSMAITAIFTAAFAGGFTSVRTEGANIAFSSMVNFGQHAFYSILYSYTPEVMPTAHRGTGCGLAMACGRTASLACPFIATFTDLKTSIPIWVCVGLYAVMACLSLLLPYEPKEFSSADRW